MDSVRFGRALGIGARSAAKAFAGAVGAATAANPKATPNSLVADTFRGSQTERIRSAARQIQTAQTQSSEAPASGPIASATRTAARATVRTTRQARATQQGVLRGGKRFGEAVWGPIARLSGVLWLEITGAFFGIFALFAAQAAWTHRAELAGPPAMRREVWTHAAVFVAMTLVFGYFCVSSFIRARRRERAR